MGKTDVRPRVLQHIVCDDVRQEEGGKVTLVGCYGRWILVDSTARFPVLLPKLCFFFRVANVADAKDFVFTLAPPTDASGPQMVSRHSGRLSPPTSDDYVQILLALSPYLLLDEGEYKGRVSVSGASAYNFSFFVGRQQVTKDSTERRRK